MLPDAAIKVGSLSVYYGDPFCSRKIQQSISELTTSLNPGDRDIVILCIGTDRSTGDSLGPLVGTRLTQLKNGGFEVFGTLDEPVHAVNLVDVMEGINSRYHNPFIIAVDACLGKADRVGYINVKPGVLFPGTALQKSLPAVGDLHISGIVNVGGFLEHLVLQNTRLNLVFKMAEVIARGLAGFNR
ncbi:MAG: spore protease YyaC [Syntrophomonadaceae bacterium]|nr:spore protease YyaC [Syntrophomonadaceae bacterium]